MTRIRVGLVTPAYNRAAFVGESILSVLGQDFADIEYVVVNDGSTDDTLDAISEVEGSFKIVDQANKGQSATLNEQWSNLDTKYISYLSSDDTLAKEAISKAVAIMERDEEVVCVFPDFHVIDEHGKVIKRSVAQEFELEDAVVKQSCHIGPGAVFRKSAFERVGGWRTDLSLAPDWEFWIRLSKCGRIRYLDEPLAYWRLHTGSYSVKEVSRERSLELVSVLDAYFSDDVPESILSRRGEAYANAYVVVARNAFRRAALREGLAYLKIARQHHAATINPRQIIRLTRNVVSKPIRIFVAKLRLQRRRK